MIRYPLFFMLWCILGASGAFAHEGRPVFVAVTEQNGGLVSLRWKIPPVLRDADIPLIRLVGDTCQFEAGVPRPSLLGGHLYRCVARPGAVEIKYPRGNPVLSTLVMVISPDGISQTSLAPPEEVFIPLPGRRNSLAVGRDYLLEGIRHILEGYDHLLFVLCLMLLAKAPRRVVLTVTGFTLGHSATLAAAALGHVALPPNLVEALIAFSILLLAAEACKDSGDTLTSRYPASMAAAFGLLHGLGFAGALTDIGLPEGHQLTALLFFNLGVEAGQLLFVAIAFLLFSAGVKLLARQNGITGREPLLRTAAVYPAGLIAAYWTIERVTGALA